MIRIIIADDHKLIRDGLKKLFSQEIDFEVVAETNDPFKVGDLVSNNEFDVLLLDLNFPEKSGLDILVELILVDPKIKILILSMHPEDRFAIRTLKAGAMGYISKQSDPNEILRAVRKINDGRKYITPEISEYFLENINKKSDGFTHENLSDREYQVFLLLAEGIAQTQIAAKLSLSVSTVNTYRGRILEKLNLKSNAEIIHYAFENKLID